MAYVKLFDISRGTMRNLIPARRLSLIALALTLSATWMMRADDESEIRVMLQDLTEAVLARDVAAVLEHFSDEYFHGGDDYQALAADLSETIPGVESFQFTISSVQVEGDRASVSGSVEGVEGGGTFQWEEPAILSEGLGLGWLRREDGVWRIHGNRSHVGWFAVHAGHFLDDNHEFLRIAVESPAEIESVLVTGPFIEPTMLVPDEQFGGFTGFATPTQRPPAGTEYRVDIQYTNGDSETVTDTIGAWVETAPVLGVETLNGVTTFTWNNVLAEVPNARNYILTVDGGGVHWSTFDIPAEQTSAVFNFDGSAQGTLEAGQTYAISLGIQNETHDYAYRFYNITIEGASLACRFTRVERDGTISISTGQPGVYVGLQFRNRFEQNESWRDAPDEFWNLQVSSSTLILSLPPALIESNLQDAGGFFLRMICSETPLPPSRHESLSEN